MDKEVDAQEKIHKKGFNLIDSNYQYERFNKIKISNKTLEDAIINLGSLREYNRIHMNKRNVLKALCEKDLPTLREISKFFYRTNGIYARVCNYFAQLYRYDWYVATEIYDESMKTEKILVDFNKTLQFLDDSHIKKVCGEIALEVIKNGAYYGYIFPSKDSIIIQQLPINYCRSRYSIGDIPVVEFNMQFFDDYFADIQYRLKVLKLFPSDFQKGYSLYKQHKLPPDYSTDKWGSWYMLDPSACIKFNIYNDDMPIFVNAIPALLDLDAAQDLDRRKQMQQLLKILIQKLPLDKNGDLIFDVDEARDIHENAVQMLQNAIGVDVLTTFADIQVEDLADKNTSTTTDDLTRVERSVYNALGVSQTIFNSESNLATQNSILNDEGMMRNLLYQFEVFYDKIVGARSKNKKKYNFRFYMLGTTQYNYQALAKLYKEHVQNGFSKMLPQIALGQSQSFILNSIYFENEILNLSELMIPPLLSSTMSGQDILGTRNQTTSQNSQSNTNSSGENNVGRPEKEDNQKSDKTIANREAMK